MPQGSSGGDIILLALCKLLHWDNDYIDQSCSYRKDEQAQAQTERYHRLKIGGTGDEIML